MYNSMLNKMKQVGSHASTVCTPIKLNWCRQFTMSFTSQYTPVATVNTNMHHHLTLLEGSVAYIQLEKLKPS